MASAVDPQKIAQFKSITNVTSDDIARQALESTNWNLDTAVNVWFEGGLVDDASNNDDRTPLINRNNQSTTTNTNNNNNNTNRSNTSYYDWIGYIPGVNLLWWLGSCLYTLFATMGTVFGIGGLDNGPSVTDYTTIHNEFSQKYGNFNLFPNRPFRDVMRTSMDTQQCIAIYFHSHSDQRCDTFINNVLSANAVQQYINQNMIVWLADMRFPEASQLYRQVSHGVSQSRPPFVCVAGVHPESQRLVLVHRLSCANINDPTQFIGNVLDRGLQRWQQFYQQQISRRQEHQESRLLQERQNAEYLQAMEAERRKQEMMAQEQANLFSNISSTAVAVASSSSADDAKDAYESGPTAEEMERQKRFKERQQTAIAQLSEITEPTANEKSVTVNIRIRLPNGKTIQRKFRETDTIQTLFYFAECNPLCVDENDESTVVDRWELVQAYPPTVFNEASQTLKDAGMKHSANLFIQALTDE